MDSDLTGMDYYPEITQRTNAAIRQGIKVKHVSFIDNTLHVEITIQDGSDSSDVQYVTTYASLLFMLEIHNEFDQVTIRDATAGETEEYDRLQAIALSREGRADAEEQYHK